MKSSFKISGSLKSGNDDPADTVHCSAVCCAELGSTGATQKITLSQLSTSDRGSAGKRSGKGGHWWTEVHEVHISLSLRSQECELRGCL